MIIPSIVVVLSAVTTDEMTGKSWNRFGPCALPNRSGRRCLHPARSPRAVTEDAVPENRIAGAGVGRVSTDLHAGPRIEHDRVPRTGDRAADRVIRRTGDDQHPGPVLGTASVLFRPVPIKFPSTTIWETEVPSNSMPPSVLPEITFRAAAIVPPIVFWASASPATTGRSRLHKIRWQWRRCH